MSINNNIGLIKNKIRNSNLTNNAQNPIEKSLKCKLVNNKKNDYYIHTYEPKNYVDVLCKKPFNLTKEVMNKFDCCKKEKCCNVISISLYLKQNCNLGDNQYLEKTLPNIYASILNVKLNLPKWIVRLYIDKSVYKCIKELCKIKKSANKCSKICKIKEIYEKILNSENVEIYTYLCKDIVIERTRTYRFLVMCDPDVNLYVIREADGIVSNIDCHNISIYEKNKNYLFYLPDINIRDDNLIKNKDRIVRFNSYNNWLTGYKFIIETEYFKERVNIFDLLAGIFSCKLKLKRDYYFSNIDNLNKKINYFIDIKNNNISGINKEQYVNDLFRKYGPLLILNVDEKMDKFHILVNSFNIGFDEIFLLDIFKEIITLKIEQNSSSSRIFKYKIIDSELSKIEKLYQIFLRKTNDYDTNYFQITDSINLNDLVKNKINYDDIIIDRTNHRYEKKSKNYFSFDLNFQKNNLKEFVMDKSLDDCIFNNMILNLGFIIDIDDDIINNYYTKTLESIESTRMITGGKKSKKSKKNRK